MTPRSGFGLRSIRPRFVLVLLASAGIFAAVAATVTYTVEYQRTEAAALQTIEDLMTAVEKTAAVGTFTGDRLLMQEVIEGLARNRLERGELESAELVELQEQARETLTDLRELARGIHPPVLSDNGLVAAVESGVARFNQGFPSGDTQRQ